MAMLVIKGPLTDEEIRGIVDYMKRVEERRPEETFEVLMDADDTPDVMKFLDEINPQRQGYSRVVKIFRK